MAIIVDTTSPSDLLKKIKKAIDDGKVRSWSYDGDGDFTHDSEQWKNKAWLKPKVYNGELRFGIFKQKNVNLKKTGLRALSWSVYRYASHPFRRLFYNGASNSRKDRA